MYHHKKIDLEKFKKDFEILCVLRNLKIIGIFMRLAVRDKKKIPKINSLRLGND